jgi:UDP-3-O-[3-hydroxymyristoyl] glucosamine N-acyltransferase
MGGVIIKDDVYIGANCSIERASMEGMFTEIGNNCILDSGVKISHNVKMGNNVVVLGNATVAGHCVLGDYSFVGCNAYIHVGIKLGERCIVAAGTVVTKDVPDNAVVMGNPARRV